MTINENGYPKTPGLEVAAKRVMSALQRGEILAAALPRFLRKPLTPPERLATAMDVLHWTQGTVAILTNRNPRTIRRYLDGTRTVPADLVDAVEVLAAFHLAHPLPRRRTRDDEGEDRAD